MTESDDFFKLLETYLIISFAHRPVRNLFRQATMRARPVLGELGDQTALKEYQDIRKLLEAPDIGDDSLKRINDLALSVFYFELRGRVSSASYAVCHIDYGRVLMGIKRGFPLRLIFFRNNHMIQTMKTKATKRSSNLRRTI